MVHLVAHNLVEVVHALGVKGVEPALKYGFGHFCPWFISLSASSLWIVAYYSTIDNLWEDEVGLPGNKSGEVSKVHR